MSGEPWREETLRTRIDARLAYLTEEARLARSRGTHASLRREPGPNQKALLQAMSDGPISALRAVRLLGHVESGVVALAGLVFRGLATQSADGFAAVKRARRGGRR